MNTISSSPPNPSDGFNSSLCLQGPLGFDNWRQILEYRGQHIDLDNVSSVDTAGLGMLLNLLHAGKTITRCNLQIRDALKISGICRLCGGRCN